MIFKKNKRVVCFLFFGLFIVAVAPIATAQTQSTAPNSWIINQHDTELRVFTEQVSTITGRTLILDPAVKGQVTVFSGEPLDAAAVWELFQSVLRVNGFAALQAGSAWRIVPQASANQGGAPLAQSGSPHSQNLMTRLIPLRNLPSENAVRALRPLVASFGYIESLPQPNAIVITDNAENISRVEELARLLDRGDGSRVETIPLAHATARTIAPLIERTLSAQGATNGAASGPRIVADERSNVLIVRADPNMLNQIRTIVERLDEPGGGGTSIRVFRLRHADAEAVTAVLKGLVGGRASSENPVANALGQADGGGAARSELSPLAQSVLGQSLSAPGLGNLGGAGSGSAPPGSALDVLTRPVAGSGSAGKAASGFSSGDLAIQPDPALNAIVVRAPPAMLAEIDRLILDLDVRRPQVLIEAAIVEITSDDAENFGVQLGIGGAAAAQGGAGVTSFSATGVSVGQVLTALGSSVAPLVGQDGLTLGLSRRNDFAILVQALATSSKANLLSTPSLTTLDNEPASIIVGQNVPFRTGSFTTAGNSTNPFTTIERQDVGVTLKVIPRVTEGDVIRLQVNQEVSSISPTTVAGAADLITNKREIQTTILADNSQTLVLGGLITDNETASDSKIPVLGDIPVLGALFGDKQKSRSKQTLYVFLRTTILRDRDAVAAATARNYDRVRKLDAMPPPSSSLLLDPTLPKLPLDLEGIY